MSWGKDRNFGDKQETLISIVSKNRRREGECVIYITIVGEFFFLHVGDRRRRTEDGRPKTKDCK